jgi:uracil DNA glycosylase
MGDSIEIYFSYANNNQQDKSLQGKLKDQLGVLIHKELINIWSRDMIGAGKDQEHESDAHLNKAPIILLLISASFMNSCDCMREVERAIERHEGKNAHVIPILLRPVEWEGTSFGNLPPLPKNKKFITDWSNKDNALLDVAKGIGEAVEEVQKAQQAKQYETLVRLDYQDQEELFSRQFQNGGYQVGAFLIHGARFYGQIWLLNRLVWRLSGHSAFEDFKFSFLRRGGGRSLQNLWRDLAKWVDLKNISFLRGSPEDQKIAKQEIVKLTYRKWQRQSVILMLGDIDIEEGNINQFLQEFWQPLAEMVKNTLNNDKSSKANYCLLFLIDYEESVDRWSVPIIAKQQIDPTWEPHVPLKLKKLAKFSEDVLENWINQEIAILPPELTVSNILDKSDSGTPEDALNYICDFFRRDWSDFVKYQIL